MTGTHPNIKRQENLLDYNEGGELKTMGETKSIADFSMSESISLKEIDGKTFKVDHFKLKSKDENLDEDKKLDFDIWLNTKNNIIVKVEYNRLGKWQYILKNIENN